MSQAKKQAAMQQTIRQHEAAEAAKQKATADAAPAKPTWHVGPDTPSAPDRGRSRSRRETGQIAGGHHFNKGGLIDIPLPGRSRYI